MLSITIVLVIDWIFSCKISKFVTKCQNGSWIFYNIPIYSTYWTYWWMTSNISSVSSSLLSTFFFFYCLAICFQFWWQTPRYLFSILWIYRKEKVYKKWDWFVASWCLATLLKILPYSFILLCKIIQIFRWKIFIPMSEVDKSVDLI